ncbi:MAG TPA: coproporphyrinogen III oxidase family protein [Steroidobacteraceae bacterium]|nr:coproporphyrinogen III oxidase family protein [Steroidobacteraceae bacterium]
MLWFERPFLAVLRHEYAAAMRFAEDDSAEVMPKAPDAPCQLYVHVPFCEVLCPFCSFHRVRYNAAKTRRYFEALRREIRLYHEAGFRFGDVYVGGGTPTVEADELIETLALVRSLSPVRTVSIETNPNHLDPVALERYRSVGVTRLSVGVQSFDDGLLGSMERLEKYGSGAEIRERLAAAQGIFPTLNVDMIFNLPGQTLEMLDADVQTLLALEVDQISFYPLMTAPSARHKMEKTMGRSDPDLRHAMYERILDRVMPAYRAASAWCFSRGHGMFDEYIIDQDDYVGVGSGAFSYVGGAMYSTTFSLNHYCQRVEGGQSGITKRRDLKRKERMRYDYLVRLFGGELKHDYIRRRYGQSFALRMAPELAAMRLIGATRHDDDAIRLTRRGMYCWVLMMAEFFNAVNDVREHMREHIRAELETWNEEAKVPMAAIGRPAPGGRS